MDTPVTATRTINTAASRSEYERLTKLFPELSFYTIRAVRRKRRRVGDGEEKLRIIDQQTRMISQEFPEAASTRVQNLILESSSMDEVRASLKKERRPSKATRPAEQANYKPRESNPGMRDTRLPGKAHDVAESRENEIQLAHKGLRKDFIKKFIAKHPGRGVAELVRMLDDFY